MNINYGLIVTFWLITIKTVAMNNDSVPYKVIPVKECIKHIKKNGMTIFDESEYEIKSRSGVVYVLPNKEVVLVPTNFNPDYPGMIFKDIEVFKYYRDQDFFPIGSENMTWYERHNKEIREFRTNHDFYWNELKETIDIELPLRTENDVKSAFSKIQAVLKKHKWRKDHVKRFELIGAFGLAVTNFLIDEREYELIFQYGYENYNPYTEALVKKDEILQDIIYTCYINLEGKDATESLDFFMWDIGPNSQEPRIIRND